MTVRTTEMQALPRDPQGNANRKDAKRLIAKAASDMKQYTARIESELPLFRDAMNTGMNAFVRTATMSVDLTASEKDAEQAEECLKAVIAVRGMLGTCKHSMSEFRKSVAGLPKMTTELNRSKRDVTSALDSLISEFANGETLLTESEKVIRDLLGEPEDGT